MELLYKESLTQAPVGIFNLVYATKDIKESTNHYNGKNILEILCIFIYQIVDHIWSLLMLRSRSL